MLCVTQIVSDTEDKQLSKDTFGLDRIHRRCIKQTAYVNQEKQNEKERRLRNAHKSLKLSLGLLVAALLSFLLSIASFQNFIDHSLSEALRQGELSFGVISPALFFWLFIFLAIFSLCVFLTANSNRKLAENISTSEFQYDFTKKFCLLSTRANKSGMPFPHLKLLIVDEKTAFLGSLNFTVSGVNTIGLAEQKCDQWSHPRYFKSTEGANIVYTIKIKSGLCHGQIIKMTSFYWPIGKISGELYITEGALEKDAALC